MDFSGMSDFLSSTKLSGISGLLSTIGGIKQEQYGYGMSEAAYKNAASSARAVAGYNNRIADYNNAVSLSYKSRQADRVMSSQRAIAASSGLAVGSKSFLMAMNETMTNFDREVRQQNLANDVAKSINTYNAQNQAYQNETAAAMTRYQANNAKARSGVSLLGQVGSFLTSFK